MKKTGFILFAVIILRASILAQCPNSSAMDTLNINNVSALMLNGGDMHWNLSTAGYEVPKGSGIHSIFASGLWLGGIDLGGQLKVAAQTYRQTGNDFWPGPLDTINASATTSAAYNKIWKLDRKKIEEFQNEWALGNVQSGSYTPDPDILSWPANGSGANAHTLAPYIDLNANNTYDPLIGGDFPVIKGDQMLYWIINDMCDVHTSSLGGPLGVEIHASAYSFYCTMLPDSEIVKNYTTFYHYEIYNRSTFKLDSAYLGLWQDLEIGCLSDDYTGCIKSENYAIAYNGDSIDDPTGCNSKGYGASPPILSTVILDGPLADANDGHDNNNNGIVDEAGEKNLMTSFLVYYNMNGVSFGNPTGPDHFYNYMKGVWGDGIPIQDCKGNYTPFTNEGYPYDTSSCAEPVIPLAPGDRRFVLGTGPFSFNPGQKINYDYAIIFSRDTSLTYGTVPYYQQAEKDVALVKNWFGVNNFSNCSHLSSVAEQNSADPISISPNPSSDFILVNYESKTKHPQFEIIDVMGRTVSTPKAVQTKIDISSLPQGVYLLKVSDGELHFAKRFIKQ